MTCYQRISDSAYDWFPVGNQNAHRDWRDVRFSDRFGWNFVVWGFVTLIGLQIDNFASAQQFRQPAVPDTQTADLPEVRSTGSHAGFSQDSSKTPSRSSGFVPPAARDGLGLIPVRPRNGPQNPNAVIQLRPQYEGNLSGPQHEIIAQIRAGNFSEPETGGLSSDSQTIRQRYEDGKDQLVRAVMQDEQGNFFNHGPWQLFNRRGELLASGQFINGLMDGLWYRWHAAGSGGMFSVPPFNLFEGPFRSTATFSQGDLNGIWFVNDRYDRKIVEVPYRRGHRHGTATWYFPNSERMRVINFKEGILDGPLMEWDDKAQLVRHDEYIDGQRVIRNTAFYRPEQPSSESYHLEPQLKLQGVDSWWEAEPAEYVQTGSRIQHGPSYAWYPNGQRKMVGQYLNDLREGRFVWWHPNGQKALAGVYEQGLKNGLWTWWHDNGIKSIEGPYEEDVPVGEWTWWNLDGRVTHHQSFPDRSQSNGLLLEPEEIDLDNVVSPEQPTDTSFETGADDQTSEPYDNPPPVPSENQIHPDQPPQPPAEGFEEMEEIFSGENN